MNKTLLSVVLLASVGLSLSGCTININVPPSMGSSMMGDSQSPESQVEMFAEMMIPHHQQAIDMSELALAQSQSEDITDLARRIIDGQAPEIELMQTWIDDSNDSESMHMMGGMGMGGMATEEEMVALSGKSGSEFDREFLSLMIAHHQGALHMVHMIESASDSEVRGLAEDIIRVQTAEINEMTALLEALGDA